MRSDPTIQLADASGYVKIFLVKRYKAREVVSILKQDGWYLVKIRGSHHHFKHPTKLGKVTVPYKTGNEDIKVGTLKSILKQARINLREVN